MLEAYFKDRHQLKWEYYQKMSGTNNQPSVKTQTRLNANRVLKAHLPKDPTDYFFQHQKGGFGQPLLGQKVRANATVQRWEEALEFCDARKRNSGEEWECSRVCFGKESIGCRGSTGASHWKRLRKIHLLKSWERRSLSKKRQPVELEKSQAAENGDNALAAWQAGHLRVHDRR